jgi:hypothetical protein
LTDRQSQCDFDLTLTLTLTSLTMSSVGGRWPAGKGVSAEAEEYPLL